MHGDHYAGGKKRNKDQRGQESKLDVYLPEIVALLKNGSTQKYIARRCSVTEAMLSHWIKKNKVKGATKFPLV